MKKILSTGLVVSILLAIVAIWMAIGYDVEHRVHQREIGAEPASAHAHL
ncbi:MAG TPA: hypothetical protein VF285_05235 [Castellaniella sp.]